MLSSILVKKIMKLGRKGDVYFSQILCRGVTCRTGRDGIPQSFASQMPAPFSKGAFGAETDQPAPKAPLAKGGEGRRTQSGGGGIPLFAKVCHICNFSPDCDKVRAKTLPQARIGLPFFLKDATICRARALPLPFSRQPASCKGRALALHDDPGANGRAKPCLKTCYICCGETA